METRPNFSGAGLLEEAQAMPCIGSAIVQESGNMRNKSEVTTHNVTSGSGHPDKVKVAGKDMLPLNAVGSAPWTLAWIKPERNPSHTHQHSWRGRTIENETS